LKSQPGMGCLIGNPAGLFVLEPRVISYGKGERPVKKKMPQLDKIYLGDCLQILKSWPDAFLDTCITSPPYWALRDFGAYAETVWDGDENCEHNFNAKKKTSGFCSKCGAWRGQLGLEPSFDLFIKHLCDIFDEIKRVLKPGGTCWVNMGDTYGGSMQGYGATKNSKTGFQKTPKNAGYYASSKNKPPMANMMQKCLLQIPSRLAIEMCKRGWILRNEIIWHKPNCMPTAVKDRFTVDFEKIFLFTKEKKYFFETQYEPMLESSRKRYKGKFTGSWSKNPHSSLAPREADPNRELPAQGRNKRTVWRIPGKPFRGAHFAVYPPELCETPIKAGCPEFICKKCGEPRKKIYDVTYEPRKKGGETHKEVKISNQTRLTRGARRPSEMKYGSADAIRRNVGMTDCGCNAWFKPGIVFDPFMGSGTTAMVAKRLGRRFLGTEANPEYKEMAERRLKDSNGKKINPNSKRKE